MPKGYPIRIGWTHSDESKKLMSERRSGLTGNENNHRWQGDNASYAALHNWVRAHFTKPVVCEKCGSSPGCDSLGRTKLHWANKSKEYRRDREDWMCLCPICHRNYDIKTKKKHRYEGR